MTFDTCSDFKTSDMVLRGLCRIDILHNFDQLHRGLPITLFRRVPYLSTTSATSISFSRLRKLCLMHLNNPTGQAFMLHDDCLWPVCGYMFIYRKSLDPPCFSANYWSNVSCVSTYHSVIMRLQVIQL